MYQAPNLQKPSLEEVAQLSEQLSLDIDKAEIGDYHEVISGFLKSYSILEKYPEPKLEVKFPRTPGYRPSVAENKYNAWYNKTEIQGAPSGLLHGKTVAIKDCFPVAGVPMMNGSRVLEGYVPDYDATIITRILDAGACIKGKAVCENFCWSGHSFMSVPHPVLNPHDIKRTTGGSSSGCAALVYAGEVDMAIGSDQGGSIRVPASWTGIVGHKPTYGLVPYTGIPSFSHAYDTAGPMTRTVYDCALMLEAIAGFDDGKDPRQTKGEFAVPKYTKYLTGDLSGIKVGILREGFEGCQPDVSEMVRSAAQQLTTKGATVEETSIPIHKDVPAFADPGALEGAYHAQIQGCGFHVGPPSYYATSAIENLHAFAKARAKDFSPIVKTMSMLGKHIMDNYGLRFYAKSQNLVRMATEIYTDALKNYDVLIMPTVRFKAPELPPSTIATKDLITLAENTCDNTVVFNATGHPAVSINTGLSEGLPVGMMIVGRHFDDAITLKVAHAYEQLRDATV